MNCFRARLGPTRQCHAVCDPKELNCAIMQHFAVEILYHFARTRYFNTDSPFAFTGTSNCAAQALVFVYL